MPTTPPLTHPAEPALIADLVRRASAIQRIDSPGQWRDAWTIRDQLNRLSWATDRFPQYPADEINAALQHISAALYDFCRRFARQQVSDSVRPLARYVLSSRRYVDEDLEKILRTLMSSNALRADRHGTPHVVGLHLSVQDDGTTYKVLKPCAYAVQPRIRNAVREYGLDLPPLDQDLFETETVNDGNKSAVFRFPSSDGDKMLRDGYIRRP